MSEHYDHGPLQTYEITWKSGHVETVQAHQVQFGSWGNRMADLFGGALSVGTRTSEPEPRLTIHGEFDGKWRLVLSAPESEVHTIRLVTPAGERAEP